VIIVEGPDGSGKTTLANKLAMEFDLRYLKSPHVSSATGPDDEAHTWWQDQLKPQVWKHIGVVHDRCYFISEAIYMPHRGKPSACGPHTWLKSMQYLVDIRPVVIFCLPDFEKLVEVYVNGQALPTWMDEDTAEMVYWQYFDAMGKWSLLLNHTANGPVMQYDWTNENKVVEAVHGYLIRGGSEYFG
jgi:hypothetical protein